MGVLEALQPELGEQRSRAPARLGARTWAMRSASAALSRALSHGSSRSRWGISAAGAHAIEPRVGRLQPADQLQQGGLAAAARSDHREQLAVVGVQGHAGERLHGAPCLSHVCVTHSGEAALRALCRSRAAAARGARVP